MVFKEYELNENLYLPVPGEQSNRVTAVEIKDFDSLLEHATADPSQLLGIFMYNKLRNKVNKGLKIIQWPDKVIETNTANCVDIAIMAHYYCKNFNIENYIVFLEYLSVLNPVAKNAHCVLIYKFIDHYWIFDYFSSNVCDIHGPFGTLEQACKISVDYFLALFRSLLRFRSYSADSNPFNDYMIGNYFYLDKTYDDKLDGHLNTKITQENLLIEICPDKLNQAYEELINALIKERMEYPLKEPNSKYLPKYLPLTFHDINPHDIDLQKVKLITNKFHSLIRRKKF